MEVKNEQINGMVYWWSIGFDYRDYFIYNDQKLSYTYCPSYIILIWSL